MSVEAHIHIGLMRSPSIDSRLTLKSSFSPKVSKPRKGGTFEFFNGYYEAPFIGVSIGLKIDLKCLNLGLSNRSGRVGFVFGSKLNGLKTPRPKPDLFNKRVQKPDLNPFNFYTG